MYTVDGMHCEACVKKITAALSGQADEVKVTLLPPELVLQGSRGSSIETLNALLAGVGKYRLRDRQEVFQTERTDTSWLKTYYPLLLIIGIISLVSLKSAATLDAWMLNFMAGFFITFGFFKLLDIRGFANAYQGYDLLAKRVPVYGLVYPFIELALGFAFLFGFALTGALWASILLMSFSSLGVINALRKKQKIRCACLGSVLNLPMSTITLVEDLGMVLMAIVMLMSMM